MFSHQVWASRVQWGGQHNSYFFCTKTLLKYRRDILKFALNIVEMPLKYSWDTLETTLNHPWNTLKTSLSYILETSLKNKDDFWGHMGSASFERVIFDLKMCKRKLNFHNLTYDFCFGHNILSAAFNFVFNISFISSFESQQTHYFHALVWFWVDIKHQR